MRRAETPSTPPRSAARRAPRGLGRASACLLAMPMLLGGCNSAFYRHQEDLQGSFAQGRYQAAAEAMDTPSVKNLYGDKNVLLYWLDRGSLALALDEYPRAIDLFERAESYMTLTDREGSAGDNLARWLINDTAAPYLGFAYEDVYVNTFKLLAQLERGEIQGGATVEARRAAAKADQLRDRYVRLADTVAKRDARATGAASSAPGAPAMVNSRGEFVESTLATLLTAVTFMKSGDRDLQAVAGRRLVSSIELQQGLQTGVDPRAFAEVGTADPASVNVLAVAISGRGPTKRAVTVGPIPIAEYPLYFQLPELVGGVSEVGSARLVTEAGGAYPMQKVEDLRAVATENFRRELPLIYARTLIRATAKSVAIYAGSKAAQSGSRGDTRTAIQIGTILGGLAAMILTEEADLRSWQFLPARADAVVALIPPGTHRVRIEFLSSTGGVLYASPWRDITVSSGPAALSTLAEHYWR